MDAQRTSTDLSNEGEVPTGPEPGPLGPRVVQLLDHPSEKRKISEVDTIPDENNWMGTDVLSLEYSQDHIMIVSYLYRISEDHRSLQLNPTFDAYSKLLELSWKALSDCIVRYTDFKGANYHSKGTKCLMFLANKIIESVKTCIETSVEHYGTIAGRELLIEAILTCSLCSFFDKALTELHNLCAGSDEVMMIGFIPKLLIGILRSIDWQSKNEIHKQLFEGILAVILNHVGKLVSNLIFGEDVAASHNPGNISSGETFYQPYTRELWISKYLIPILATAVKIQKEKCMNYESEELLRKARRKIQNTFKNSMIGTSLNGLLIPENIEEELLDIPELKELELYGREWTIQCVFTMVGVEDDDVDEGSEMLIN